MSIEAEGENPGASKPDPAGKGTGRGGSSGRALMTIDHEATPKRGFGMKPSQGVVAAAVALVLGGGFMGGAALFGSKTTPTVAMAQANPPPPPDPQALLLQKVQDEVHTLKVSLDSMRATSENSRQDDAIRALKKSVDILKQDLEVAKATNATSVAQLGGKLDKLDRDPTPKLAEIAARLDRLDRSDKEPSARLADISTRLDQLKLDSSSGKLAEITARLDRIEKQVSAPTPVASIMPPPRPAPAAAPAPVPVQVAMAAAPDPKAQPKPATVDGWMLRDVYGGVALLEGRSGLREVSAGQFLPGVGEIRSIERRGRSWVVVTSRGTIEADNRW